MAVAVDFSGKDKGVSAATRKMDREAKRYEKTLKDLTTQAFKAGDTLKQAMQKSVDATRKYNAELERTRRKTMSTAEASQAAFGSKMLTSIGAMIGPVVLLHRAYASITRELEVQKQLRTEAGEGVRSTEVERAKLVQLAGGDPQEYRRLTEAAKRMEIGGGMLENQSLNLISKMKSVGVMDQFGDIQDIIQSRAFGEVEETMSLLNSYFSTARGFGESVGTVREFFSRMLEVSKTAPVFAGEIARQMGEIGQVAGRAGVTENEAAGALELLTEATSKPDVARTQLNRYLSKLAEHDILQGSLAQRTLMLQQRGMSNAELQTMFGDRGVKAFVSLSEDLRGLTDRIERLAAASEEDLTGASIRILEDDLSQRQLQESRSANARVSQELRDKLGPGQILVEDVRRQVTGRTGVFERIMRGIAEPAVSMGVLSPEEEVRQLLFRGRLIPGIELGAEGQHIDRAMARRLDPATLRQSADTLLRLEKITEAQNQTMNLIADQMQAAPQARSETQE